MKELILDLRDSSVALIGVFCQFIWDILRIIFFIIGYPFSMFYRLLISPFHISVWYKYYFTDYYQKHLNEFTVKRMFRLLKSNRTKRQKSLYVRNERKWAVKILKRYRYDLEQTKPLNEAK